MNASRDDQRSDWSVPWGWIAVAVALSPLLYVLSIGPAGWAVDAGHFSRGQFHTLYAPVVWLHAHTLLEKPLEWYAGLWGW